MRVTSIRFAIAALMEDADVTLAEGQRFAAVSPFPVEQAPASFPFAFLGDANADGVSSSPVELWDWHIPLTIVVAPLAESGDAIALAESAIAGAMQQIRANQTLGGLTMRVKIDGVNEGVVRYGGARYYGFTIGLGIKERVAATYRA